MSAPPRISRIAEINAAVGLFVTSKTGEGGGDADDLDFFGGGEGASSVSNGAS